MLKLNIARHVATVRMSGSVLTGVTMTACDAEVNVQSETSSFCVENTWQSVSVIKGTHSFGGE